MLLTEVVFKKNSLSGPSGTTSGSVQMVNKASRNNINELFSCCNCNSDV